MEKAKLFLKLSMISLEHSLVIVTLRKNRRPSKTLKVFFF